MLLDIVLASVLALFVFMGARRGALAAGAGVVALVLAYGVGVYAATHFGAVLSEDLDLPGLLGPPLAGSIGFLLAYVVCGIAASLLKARERAWRGDEPRPGLDRAVGGLFGALRGSLVVLLLAWLGIWLDAARDLGVSDAFAAMPDASASRVAGITQSVVEGAVASALESSGKASGSGARMAGRMVARPSETLQSLQSLLDDERIRALQEDHFFWTLVESGASERALNRRTFYVISHDEQMRERLAELGLISEEAARDVGVFRSDALTVLEEVGPRVKGLTEDPEIQRLAHDPEIVAMLESGDTFGLLGHPEIRNLVARVSADD
ncbi:MAG: CvpA family protein [Deltaproteobacteria bacterium]|nr:CvpA family protein [Deltaproteobacteria bacterium]MBW2419895.1 CvpA family protein [Deltaproteobacteria bacterium]